MRYELGIFSLFIVINVMQLTHTHTCLYISKQGQIFSNKHICRNIVNNDSSTLSIDLAIQSLHTIVPLIINKRYSNRHFHQSKLAISRICVNTALQCHTCCNICFMDAYGTKRELQYSVFSIRTILIGTNGSLLNVYPGESVPK